MEGAHEMRNTTEASLSLATQAQAAEDSSGAALLAITPLTEKAHHLW